MWNTSTDVGVPMDPKLELLVRLTRECYNNYNITHSQLLETDMMWEDNDTWCPRTFDGFACWDETPPGATAVQPCPPIVIGFDPERFVYRRCTANGSWYIYPHQNRSWTNYTTCIDFEDLEFRNTVNNIYVAGYCVSLIALLLSMVTFMYFKALQCTRIKIHMHLFTSFSLNSVAWILWTEFVISDAIVVQNNEVWCQLLHVVTNYFLVCSYTWMFCEGLHLHIALVLVFIKDDLAMRWFVVMGWGAPLLIVAAYTVVRFYSPGATEQCWIEQNDTFWIITIPVMVSLIASFVFLVNVVRVLVMKMQPRRHPAALATRKAVRAALILIPLFGLHFMLIPLRPAKGTPGEKIYQIFSALITSLQGLCVAVLFCFTNHEVIHAVRAQLALYRRRSADHAIAMTGILFPQYGMTGGDSHTRDNIA